MRAKLLVRSFINGGVHEAGEVLEVEELDGRLEALADNPPKPKNADKHKRPPKDDLDDAFDD